MRRRQGVFYGCGAGPNDEVARGTKVIRPWEAAQPGGVHADLVAAADVPGRVVPDLLTQSQLVSTSGNLAEVTTRVPHGPPAFRWSGTVALDRKLSMAPSTSLGKLGGATRAEGPCCGGPVGQPHTFLTRTKVTT